MMKPVYLFLSGLAMTLTIATVGCSGVEQKSEPLPTSTTSAQDITKRQLTGRWNTENGTNDYEFTTDGSLLYYKKGENQVEYQKKFKVLDVNKLFIESLDGKGQAIGFYMNPMATKLELQWKNDVIDGVEKLKRAN